MEQRLFDRSSRASSLYPNSRDYSVANLQPNSKIEQRLHDQFVFTEVVEVAGDWLEAANGSPLNKRQYDNLFKKGYVSHPSTEVLRIFDDWDDFQQISATYYQDGQQEKEQKRDELLEAIEEEMKLGLLPEVLFQEAVPYTVTYCEVEPTSGEKGKVKKLQRSQLTGNQAPTVKILERYAKYTLINYLLQDRPSEDMPSEQRKASIAMGFNLESGKSLSSFKGSLKNSNTLLSDVDIDEAIEKLELDHLIHPESRQQHLTELLNAGMEQLYDTKYMRLLGKTATASYLKGETQKLEHIHYLPELLLSDELNEQVAKRGKKREVSKLTNEQILEYGKWLAGIIEAETGEATLNREIIERASKLRLGISPDQIVRRFGSLAKFYAELGLANAKKSKLYHEYEIEDFAQLVAQLGERLGRKPTQADIDNEAKNDPSFPSSHVMTGKDYSLRQILEHAGWPDIYSWDISDYEQHGLRFMQANDGLMPTQKAWDFLSKQKRGPSAAIIRFKYDGGFSEFKARVKALYDEQASSPERMLHEVTSSDNLDHLKLPAEFMTARRKSLVKSVIEVKPLRLAA